jgi:hypothetical protein
LYDVQEVGMKKVETDLFVKLVRVAVTLRAVVELNLGVNSVYISCSILD